MNKICSHLPQYRGSGHDFSIAPDTVKSKKNMFGSHERAVEQARKPKPHLQHLKQISEIDTQVRVNPPGNESRLTGNIVQFQALHFGRHKAHHESNHYRETGGCECFGFRRHATFAFSSHQNDRTNIPAAT